MQVTHPQGGWNGIPAENVFIATDDLGSEAGRGYVIYQYQPHLYPDCPVNLYLSLDWRASGSFMLFGALIARARQLRDSNPGVQARVYTCIAPDDEGARAFFEQGGMRCEDREVLLRLPMPEDPGRIPMNCEVVPCPLNTPEEVSGLILRLQQNDITHITQEDLGSLRFTPHFRALGLSVGGYLAGEALLAGSGADCELAAIYIAEPYRRRGLGKALLTRCMAMMAQEGVTGFTARFVTRSLPQKQLALSFHALDLGTTALFPAIFL